ncbi:adaptin ear-binding coat-associated protein 1 [Rhodotorula diobovata]|uniref:Adaptin ear-binding coat-associated protein 1 n=1 Tax=Rhodotorula diobovata TaxID=5288 RepID=A0A5C5G4A1_9BASI|nr:adaptin ear-binding coat-associated protein 1 [Rhodotorula diobovata]
MDSTIESILFIAREVYVYQIPPRQSNAGYRAAEWGEMTEPMWRGRLRVIERGSDIPTECLINLEDKDSGELFAQAPYKPSKQNPNGGCEAVLDSSRYFVLTVVDGTNRAYIGMGFPERSESFDFNLVLTRDPPSADWSKRQNPPKILATPSSSSSSSSSPSSAPAQPARDFSLKEGETISIKLGGMSTKKKAPAPGGGAGGGLGGFMLPPPPPAPPRGR